MTGLPSIGGDVERVLESVSVPSYALDAANKIDAVARLYAL